MTLAELANLLKHANLFIGNDSGPMHIASACGIKVIGLYGPTNPERFGPYGHNCIALRMEDKCPPCAQDKCKFKDYRCIDRISVDDVMEAIKGLKIED
jgi:ADP-heptose:LPS heptosyltransferase